MQNLRQQVPFTVNSLGGALNGTDSLQNHHFKPHFYLFMGAYPPYELISAILIRTLLKLLLKQITQLLAKYLNDRFFD